MEQSDKLSQLHSFADSSFHLEMGISSVGGQSREVVQTENVDVASWT